MTLTSLPVLDFRVCECTNCELVSERKKTFTPSVAPTKPFSGLMIVGEGPGFEEARMKVPFVGASGRCLDALLKAAGIDRETCYIANATGCFPTKEQKNEKGLVESCPNAVPSCLPRLLSEISLVRPRVILALGQAALVALTGEDHIQAKRQERPLCNTCLGNLRLPWWKCPSCATPNTYLGAVAVDTDETQRVDSPVICKECQWTNATQSSHALIDLAKTKKMCPACGGKKTQVVTQTKYTSDWKVSWVAGGIFHGADLCLSEFGVKYVIPTYHPSFLLHKAKNHGGKEVGGQFMANAVLEHLNKARRLLTQDTQWNVKVDITTDPLVVGGYTAEDYPEGTCYALDIETDALDPGDVKVIKCLGIHRFQKSGMEQTNTLVVDTTSPSPTLMEMLRDFLEDPKAHKVFQNGIYDTDVIERLWGIKTAGYVADTLIAHNALSPDEPHHLHHLAFTFTDASPWKPPKSKGGIEAFETKEELFEYNGRDCAATAQAMQRLWIHLEKDKVTNIHDVDLKMVALARRMRQVGLPIDPQRREEIATRAEQTRVATLVELQKLVGKDDFNPNSSNQLTWALYDPDGPFKLVPTAMTDAGKPSADKTALSKYKDHAFVKQLIQYRQAKHTLGTYIEGMAVINDRIHFQWNPLGARTGRWTSSPNCFSSDTEILTEQGWVPFPELPENVRVAQWDEKTQALSWTFPTQYIRKEFHGALTHVSNQHIDLLMTDDHRCLLQRRTGAFEVVPAKGYLSDRKQWHAAPGPEEGLNFRDSAIALLCAIQADGSWYFRADGSLNTIVFSFKKERKQKRIREILEDLEIAWKESPKRYKDPKFDQTRFTVSVPRDISHAPVLAWCWRVLGPAKKFDWSLLQWSAQARGLFCKELFFWDGCWSRGSMYASNIKHNADVGQAMLTLNNTRAKLRVYQGVKNPSYQLDATKTHFSWTTNIEKTATPYDGYVYCVSVPSSYIVVRRNGRTAITGQCQNWDKDHRWMCKPKPGRTLVGADFAQQQYRVLAAMAGDEAMIRLCLTADENRKLEPDYDPHSYVSRLAFGNAFLNLQLKDPTHKKDSCKCETCARKALRDLTKRVVYGLFFGGGAQTIRDSIVGDPDYNGPNLSIETVQGVLDAFYKAFPRIRPFQDACYRKALETYEVRDPVLGRRRVFPFGDIDYTVAVNFPVQSADASIMTLGLIDLIAELPAVDASAEIVAIVHDACYIECDENKADAVSKILENCLTCEMALAPDAPDMLFPASAHSGPDWGSV